MKRNEGKAGVILLIIVLILMMACAAAYGYLYVTKLENRIIALENEKNNEQKVEEGSQSKDNTIKNQTVETNKNNSEIFTNEEIKISVQNYLNLVGANEGSSEGMLATLKLTTYQEQKEHTDDNYAKTNIKYSDYKNKMLEYMTEEWFQKNFTAPRYKDVDGYLWYLDVGATGVTYEVDDVYLKGDYSDNVYIAKIHTDEEYLDSWKEKNVEFHISNNNGKCVISYCD